MKNTLIIGTGILLISMNALASEFCEGFKKGYSAGYKRASGSSIEPITPICPIQPIKGFGDPKSDYEHGYVIGLEKGMENGRR